MAKKTYPANIDWRIPPGQMLVSYLEDREKTPEDLAIFMGVSVAYVQDLLSSKTPMTFDHAEKITAFLGMPDYYWRNSVLKYDDFLAKKRGKEIVLNWIKQFPYAELAKLNLLKPARAIQDKLAEMLKYLDIEGASPTDIQNFLNQRNLAYRQSDNADNLLSKAFFIKYGEIKFSEQIFPPFNLDALKNLLPELRELINLEPEEYSTLLRERLAEVGVCLIFVPSIKRLKVKGVTNSSLGENPIIQISVGNLREDSFWFTLFHELGHVVLHANRLFWDDEESLSSTQIKEESEANDFASRILIEDFDLKYWSRKYLSLDQVEKHAHELKTKPCIILGHLHFLKLREFSFGGKLCKHLKLKDDLLYYSNSQ